MSLPTLQQLVDGLRDRVADPARRQLVVAIAMDAAQLHARRLAGELVEGELRHVAAQAANLTAVEAAMVRDAIVAWIGEGTRVLVGAVCAAAAG